MFEKNNLTKQKLEELAELILWLVPAHANVAVGSAAWVDDAMDKPQMVALCSGDDTIALEDSDALKKSIASAAAAITADDHAYDYKANRVFTFGIRGKDGVVGAIFVAIDAKLSANIYFKKKKTVSLIEDIEDLIVKKLAKGAGIAWRYGVLVNHAILISEEEVDDQ